jgi:hypothetical protein
VARFIGFVQGQSGEASRIGSPRSGMTTHARGWNVGAKVYGHVTPDDRDVFDIYTDGGSNGHVSGRYVGRVELNEDGEPEFIPAEAKPVEAAAVSGDPERDGKAARLIAAFLDYEGQGDRLDAETTWAMEHAARTLGGIEAVV